MERREFIIKSGTILTAAAFISMFPNAIFAKNSDPDTEELWKKRPNPADFKQAILKAIAYGVNAPSPHNTQSWKFEILSDAEMNLYADENILLPATDPPARQIHLGLGTFAETLKIGATIFGYETEIKWFPKGHYTLSEIGKKPAANIKITKSNIVQKHELADCIYKRTTNRGTYKGKIITSQEIETIKKLSKVSHSEIFFKNETSEIEAFSKLFYDAFVIEQNNYTANEETRKMFRFSEAERAKLRNGISIPQMGYHGMMMKLAEKSLKNGDKEIWHSEKTIEKSLKSIKKNIESSKAFVFFKTKNNTQLDWVKTGQDYVRFNLALVKLDLYTHPYNQVIQEYSEMQALQKQFNQKIKCETPAKIQMIGRIGRADETYLSYRRFIKDMKV